MEPITTDGRTRPWPVVAVMILAQMLIWLDNSILNVAVSTLADPVVGLGAGAGDLEWIASSYTLVFASTLLAGGALADRFGPRATLLAGLVIFAVSSAAGAYASTPGQLIVARGFMGAGSGLLMPSTLSIIVLSTPVAIRTRAIAIWGSSSGLGVAIGPVTGGVLLSHFWWGSVFLVNVPIVVLCLIGIVALVPPLRSAQRRALDLPGLALSILGFGGFVYGIIDVGQRLSWTAPTVLFPLLGGAAMLVAFVLWQRRSTSPSVDLRLFTQRRFAAGSIVLLLVFMGLSGQLFFAAFYLQGPRGLSPQTAGAIMIAAAVGIILGSQLAPTATRLFSAPTTSAAGVLATGATYFSYLWFDQQTPVASIVVMLFVQGLGMGVVGTPVTVAMMSGVPAQLAGAGSAVNSVARQVGSTLGVAVTGSILTAIYRQQLAPALVQLPAQQQDLARTSAEGARSLARSLNLPALAEAADRAFLEAMNTAAVFTTLLALVGSVAAAAGLRVRARHRADRRAAAPRPRRARRNVQAAETRHQPAFTRWARPTAGYDCFDRWNPGGGEASTELALHQLKIVLAIAESGSLGRAASSLRISRPELAADLRRIEHGFGGRLFDRSVEGEAALTELGVQVVVRARELVNESDDLLTAARTPAPTGPDANIVRIGGVESALLAMITLAAEELLPGLERTTTIKTSSDAVLELVRTGELDLAVLADFPGVPEHQTGRFNSGVLLTEPLFVGLSAGHPLARLDSIPLALLADEAWVAPPSHLDGLWLSFRLTCERAGFNPRFRHFGASLTMAAEFVRSGGAVAVLPADMQVPSGMVRRPLTGHPLWRRMRMVWRPDSPVAEVIPEIRQRALSRYRAALAPNAVGEIIAS